jgi:CheY-like chemotaxis protein
MEKGEQKTVLVVDDEVSIRKMTCVCLQRLGFRVLEAGTSTDAAKLLTDNSQSIHLLITDITLAGSEDNGLEFARRIRNLDGSIPIVIASGNAPETYASEVSALAPCHALPKPFVLSELISIVRELTGSRT